MDAVARAANVFDPLDKRRLQAGINLPILLTCSNPPMGARVEDS